MGFSYLGPPDADATADAQYRADNSATHPYRNTTATQPHRAAPFSYPHIVLHPDFQSHSNPHSTPQRQSYRPPHAITAHYTAVRLPRSTHVCRRYRG